MIRFTRRDFTALAATTLVRPTLARADPSPIARAIPKTVATRPATSIDRWAKAASACRHFLRYRSTGSMAEGGFVCRSHSQGAKPTDPPVQE